MITKRLLLTLSFIFFTQTFCMDMSLLPPEMKSIIAYNCDSLADCAAFISTCKENADKISILKCILQNPVSLLHPNYTEVLVHYAQPFKNYSFLHHEIDEQSIDYKDFNSIVKAESPDNQKERSAMISFCSSETRCTDTTITDTIKTYLTRDYLTSTRALGSVPQNITAFKMVIINQYLNDMKSTDHDGKTELLTALDEQNDLSLIWLLLKYSKNNIDYKDYFGNTALHYACRYEDKAFGLEIVKRLIHYGCNVNITSNNGQTPLHIALPWEPNKQNMDIARLLVENGADLDNTLTPKTNMPLISRLCPSKQRILLEAARKYQAAKAHKQQLRLEAARKYEATKEINKPEKRNEPDSGHDNTGESAAKRSRK